MKKFLLLSTLFLIKGSGYFGGYGGGVPSISGPILGGTDGSVLFVNPSGQINEDNANFFWDNSNNRLGLGLNNPQYTLDVDGTFNLTGAATLGGTLDVTGLTSLGAVSIGTSLTITPFNAIGLLINNASGVVASKAPGTDGYVLQSDSGDPSGFSWVAVGSAISGSPNYMTVYDGLGNISETIGTSNQLFGTNSAGDGYEHKGVTATSAGDISVAGTITGSVATDSASTGSNVVLPMPTTDVVRLTNASLTSFSRIGATTGQVSGRQVTIFNLTGNTTIDILHNTGLGQNENRILTPDGLTFKLYTGSGVTFRYDATTQRWRMVNPPTIGTARYYATYASDGVQTSEIGTSDQVAGVNNAGTEREFKTISGTANQVSVTHGVGTITLATPQNIGTGSSPTFAGLTVGSGTGAVISTTGALSTEAQLALSRGGTNKNMTAAAGGVVYTDADSQEVTAAGTSGQFLRSDGSSAPGWASFISPNVQTFTSGSGTYNLAYTFIISSGSATAGATYTNNAVTFTVLRTVSSETMVVMRGSGAPAASGTLTKASGTGDATLTFSLARAPIYLKVRMVGGGGGTDGTGDSAGSASSAGGASTFGSSLLTANGGPRGAWNNTPAAAATATINAPAFGTTISGGVGAGLASVVPSDGKSGAASFFGGGGAGGFGSGGGSPSDGGAGAAYGSAGGQGAMASTTGAGAAGGGSGAYLEAVIPNPSATYAYAVGSGGSGGPNGTDGADGGAGASGYIEVTEHYQ